MTSDFIAEQVSTIQALKSMADGTGSLNLQSLVDAFAAQIISDTGGDPEKRIPLSRDMLKQRRLEAELAARAVMDGLAADRVREELRALKLENDAKEAAQIRANIAAIQAPAPVPTP